MSSRLSRNLLMLMLFAVFFAAIWQFMSSNGNDNSISLNRLVTQVNNGQVREIKVDGNGETLYITLNDDRETTSRKGAEQDLASTLIDMGAVPDRLYEVEMPVAAPSQWGGMLNLLGGIFPLLLFGGFLIFMLRQAQGSNNQAMSFGKSRARMFTGDKPTVTFDDVAGAEEAKQELAEIVEFLKEPEKFMALGARIPKGVLMVGPPGTGKTLMARAVAGEAGVPFFSISGSEFVEMFVGVGASRVRDLFEQAKEKSPCIIFIDEIDAVGRQRGAGLGGSHDEREQTLNQILVEMDGFDSDTNIILIAATNRPDILDPALLRPGRFDRRVTLDRPDVRGRRAILEVHTRGKPLAHEVDLNVIARGTPGMAGADLENLVNEAAILAARRNKKRIGMPELQEAIERVMMGPERRSRILSKDERLLTAYHEAGHAVAMHFAANFDPVHKITIIPRGQAGGYTMWLPDEDRTLQSKTRIEDQLVGALGGRAAEEIIWGDVSTGASDDLQRVTQLARSMVTRYGMSEKLGPLTYGDREEMVFLGREISEQRNYSERVAKQIDAEVRRIVTAAYDQALDILRTHRDKLEALSERLLDVETVERKEFEALMLNPQSPFVEELSLP
ncbi:MAG: ATP-dependent metallopeptidase FtsH/Yme1/Tma family protein [Ardenticatenales bacterium]|nr:ATP-dependent metallopeptidase FtsH/Yme1/Tma family protein [Ardenticatenales bacterium]